MTQTSTGSSAPSRRSLPSTAPERDERQRRAIDVLVATLGLVAFSPLLALIGILIKLESPGPVFFTQKRVGKDGRPFEIIKFRSMTVAEPGQQTPTEAGDMESFVFRPVGRKTAIGRALRACSLDELPNLLNVLRGDLHLVGPRPDEPELVARYRPEWQARHDVKPGITGLAQVNGRTDLTYSEMMTYDLDYVSKHPFARDVKIMLKTLGVVLRREGAR
ncbi:MAG: sugar transferase [Dehalococcoidia bacterium]|nr:sugar transferase [Dehalococcoidia bacterium]